MSRNTLIGEFYLYLKSRKKFWLLPIILCMLALGLLIAISQGSVLAPFIYTVF